MRSLGLQVGDLVTVQRAGDVIPQVVGRVQSASHQNTSHQSVDDSVAALAARPLPVAPPWSMPSVCPACGSPVVRAAGGGGRLIAGHTCSGSPVVCGAQAVEGLAHGVSHTAAGETLSVYTSALR